MKLFIFILISYGLSNILIYGSIFEKLRNKLDKLSPNFWGKLFSCFICLPTWIGFIGSYLIWSPSSYYEIVTTDLSFFNLFNIPKELISTFLDGCLTSGFVWLIHTLQESMERHYSKINDNRNNS
jgi:hypothetical protein